MLCVALSVSLFFVYFCEGSQSCNTSDTLFVPERGRVIFDTKVELPYTRHLHLKTPDGEIFYLEQWPFYRMRKIFYSKFTDSRIHVRAINNRLLVVFDRTKSSNSGTFSLNLDYMTFCWTLYVIDIQIESNETFIAEGSTARFQGNPLASEIAYKTVNVSLTWLLDGLYSNQTDHFLVSGDHMLIPHVTRELDGKNVTYRCTNGDVVIDVNYTLNVLYINTDNGDEFVQEGSSVVFRLNRLVAPVKNQNETMTYIWSLDGRTLNETYSFRMHANKMWIPHVTRESNKRNVSCMIKDGDGLVATINYRLQVAYGPLWPVKFIPPWTAYYLTPGETLPEIRCEVDCNPSCNTSWGGSGLGGILNLGKVSEDDTGEYICTAIRKDSGGVIDRSIYVYVQDKSTSTAVFASLGTILALNTVAILIILVCLLHVIRKYGMFKKCETLEKRKVSNTESNDKCIPNVHGHQTEPVQPAVYVALKKEVRANENALVNYSTLGRDNSLYTNTTTKWKEQLYSNPV